MSTTHHYDVIVVGVGAMGSATLYQFSRSLSECSIWLRAATTITPSGGMSPE